MINEVEMRRKDLPMNFGPLQEANANACIIGPHGNTMEFWLKINNSKILEATFTTDGDENSINCGSTAAYIVQNMDLNNAYLLTQEQVLANLGFLLPEESKHCALWAVNTIKKAIENYKLTCQQNGPIDNPCDNNCDTCQHNSCHSYTTNKQALQPTDKPKDNPLRTKHKIAVLSGKGGVGKSTVAANLAFTLASSGYKVGLLDVDIHGPSIPTLFNLKNVVLHSDNNEILPVEIGNLKIISIGFFLEHSDVALIWRGPMKMGIINQFLNEVKWGDLDFLIIDLPPGTGDEPLSIAQSFSNKDGAVIVTTPQEMSMADVRKSINFCRKLGLSILGVIENMSGFICPKCHETTYIFGSGGGEHLAKDFNIPLLGKIPIDPSIVAACDKGVPYIEAYVDSKTAKEFRFIIDSILQRINNRLISN